MSKKILYIHQLFRHPSEFGGTRSYWIAKELIKNGYDVTILCQRNPLLFPNTYIPPIEIKSIDGIRVIYIRNKFNKAMPLRLKAWSFIRFMFLSSKYALRQKHIDLVIATSTPLTVAFPALLMKLLYKKPFIFEVRDLWPEVPIKMGGIKNPFLIWVLKSFERTTYKAAKHVVCLSPGMQEGVVKHIAKSKVSVIPNMSKIEAFYPRIPKDETYSRFKLSKTTFKVVHFGAMGIVNGIDYFLDAASLLNKEENSDIEFILLGHGSQEKKLKSRKEEQNLKNLRFINSQPMAETSEIVNLCQVSFISVANYQVLEMNSANKFFDSLSAGKPILLNFKGWLKEIVEKNNAGMYVSSTDPSELVMKLKTLISKPELIKEMGENSRKLAESTYDKSILCPKFVDIVNEVIKK